MKIKKLISIFAVTLISTVYLTNINAQALGTVSTGARVSVPVSRPSVSSTPKSSVSSSSSRSSSTSKSSVSSSNASRPTTTPKFTGKLSKGTAGSKVYYNPATNTTTSSTTSNNKDKLKDKFEKFKNKPYYDTSRGFATGLLTATGTYLLLDSINNNDEPVYIDSKTGEKISTDELNNMHVSVADDENDNISNVGKFIIIGILLIFIILIFVLLFTML